jgi:hypothetical protein
MVWAANAAPGPLQGHVDSAAAAIGHSLGGTAALWVPRYLPQIQAVAGMAALTRRPRLRKRLRASARPLLLIGGQADGVARQQGHIAPLFQATDGARVWVSLPGGGHCNYTDAPVFYCRVSSFLLGNRERLSCARQQALTQRYSTAFFHYHLKHRRAYAAYLYRSDQLYASAAPARRARVRGRRAPSETPTFATRGGGHTHSPSPLPWLLQPSLIDAPPSLQAPAAASLAALVPDVLWQLGLGPPPMLEAALAEESR